MTAGRTPTRRAVVWKWFVGPALWVLLAAYGKWWFEHDVMIGTPTSFLRDVAWAAWMIPVIAWVNHRTRRTKPAESEAT